MRLVARFSESSLSLSSHRLGLNLWEVARYLREVSLAEIFRGFRGLQRFSEVFRGLQRFSKVSRDVQRFSEVLKPGAQISVRYCYEPSFVGMSWPTLLAFLAHSGDVVGPRQFPRGYDKVFATGLPNIPSCNTSKVWFFPH